MEHIPFKMILIGTTSAGKSTFVSRIISGKFSKDTRLTIGADLFTKKLRLNNIDITMYIWDLAGVEKTGFSLPFYCTSAKGAIIMFDLTSKKEYIRIKKWFKIFRDNAVKNAAKYNLPNIHLLTLDMKIEQLMKIILCMKNAI